MSANNAEPTGEVKNPDEPISGQNGVDYDSYASGGDTAKSDGKDINFDSQDIKKRHKTEYFVNVEGAEKRKRAEERRHAEEEKRRFAELKRMDAEMRNNSVQSQQRNNRSEEAELREITKQQKKREKNAARRTRNARIDANLKAAASATGKKLFGGKKKFIWLGAIAVIALTIGGYFLYIKVIEPARIAEIQKTTAKNAYIYTHTANEVETVIEKVQDMKYEGYSTDDILSYIEGEMDRASSEGSKLMIEVLYWRYYGYNKLANRAIDELKGVANSTNLSYVKEDAYESISLLYKIVGSDSKSEEYDKKAQEYR